MCPKEASANDEAQQEAEARKKIVIHTIISKCTDSTCEFEQLRALGAALKDDNNKLICKTISGGSTNYSFKVELESPQSGVKAVYVKMAFNYALWDPTRSPNYDLMRTQNEYEIMKSFADMMGEKKLVPTPYYCIDVEDMKLLITEWTDETDEQWANQFIDGKIDPRVAPQLAEAFATLNLSEVKDPYFNDNLRPSFRAGGFGGCKAFFAQKIGAPGEPEDEFVAMGKEMGQETFDKLMGAMEDAYMKREVLSHSDPKHFNLLVEKKPSAETLENFGPNGSVSICDWEMAYVGPPGRDPGIYMSWPVACAFSHAALGHKTEGEECLNSNNDFWNAYAKVLVEKGGKDEDFLREVFLDALGWLSLYLMGCYYLFGLDVPNLPTSDTPQQAPAVSATGLVGLKLLKFVYADATQTNMNLEEIQAWYAETVNVEMQKLLAAAKTQRPRPRRASMLRQSGRRVSDATAFEEVAKRLSMAKDPEEIDTIRHNLLEYNEI